MKLLVNEILKLKNTPAIWLTILGSAFIPTLLFTAYLYEWRQFIPLPGINPWSDYFGRLLNGLSISSSFLICLVVTLILQVEHKASAWRLIFTIPIEKNKLFIAKYIVTIGLIFCYFVLFILVSLFFGCLIGLIHPATQFLLTSPEITVAVQGILKAFLSNLGIIAIQFWIAFRINNVITTLGIGIGGIMAGLLLKDGSHSYFFPYSDPFKMIGYYYRSNTFWEPYVGASITYFLLLTVLAYTDFWKRFRG